MRILQLNTYDLAGGAARAAWRIHQGVRSLGLDSRMLVQAKTSGNATVEERFPDFPRPFTRLRYWSEILPLLPYRGRPPTHWATEWLPSGINRQIDALEPDLIHLHWVCRGFMSLADIGRLVKPVVWTLHDSWAFTGGCHVPGDCVRYREHCGRCPQLGSQRENDLSRWIRNRKFHEWQQLALTVVTPSQWLADCARSSSLFRHRRIEVIPNGIDTATYQPVQRDKARAAMGLPRNGLFILMSAMNATHDTNKGFRHLEAALQALSTAGWRDKVELLVAGQSAPPVPVNTGLPTRFLGVMTDEVSMRQAYSAADITVMPSIQENLPNTIMESMACGTPVVAFSIGGIPQLVESGVTGYLARPFETDALAASLEALLREPATRDRMGSASRLKIEREFDSTVIARRYAALYNELAGEERPHG